MKTHVVKFPKIKVSWKPVSHSEVFLNLVKNGLTRYDQIADEMGISHLYALKIGTGLIKSGELRGKNGTYRAAIH
jgi:DNA-binding IscR family transcriptional regulator